MTQYSPADLAQAFLGGHTVDWRDVDYDVLARADALLEIARCKLAATKQALALSRRDEVFEEPRQISAGPTN